MLLSKIILLSFVCLALCSSIFGQDTAADLNSKTASWLDPIKGLFRFLNKNQAPQQQVGSTEEQNVAANIAGKVEEVLLSEEQILQFLESAKRKIVDGKLTESLDDLLQVISSRPDHQAAHAISGAVLLSLAQYDLAETMLYSAVRLSNWGDYNAVVNLASTIRAKGDNSLALKTLSKALQISREDNKDKDSSGILSAGLADTYFAMGSYATAADWYLAASLRNPTNIDYWIKASTVRFPKAGQDMKFAENVLLQGIAGNPNNADLIYNLGLVMYHSDQVDKAITMFEQAIRLNAKHYDAAGALATAFHSIRRFEEALYYYDATLKNTPNNVVLLSNCAMLLNSIGRKQDGLNLAKRAYTINPNSADVLKAFAEIGIDPKTM